MAPKGTIVYTVDKKTGRKYAYISKSFRDPVTKKVKTQKTYLGRVCEETGEIIPKGTRDMGTSSNGSVTGTESASDQTIASMMKQIEQLSETVNRMKETVDRFTEDQNALKQYIFDIVQASVRFDASTRRKP